MAKRESTRDDRDGQQLRNLLLEGAKSPPSVMADTTYFETLRARISRFGEHVGYANEEQLLELIERSR